MAKTGGMGDALLIAGFNASADINALNNVGGGPAVLEFTDITQSAMARQGGVRDGRLEATTYFNPTAGMTHDKLSALPTADVIVSYLRGQSLGGPIASINSKQVNYDGSRGNDGSFTFSVSCQGNGYGLEWGLQGTPGIRTDTAATNGASIDNTAPTAFGLQAYLHVMAVTGTSVTVKIQDSPDNVTFTDVVGGAFTAATTVASQRIATASGLTVARYLRVATTGTFSNAQFAVAICRNPVAVTF